MKASQLIFLGLICLAFAATVHAARNGRMLTVSVSANAGNGDDVEVSAFDDGKSSRRKSTSQRGASHYQQRDEDAVSDDGSDSQVDDDGWDDDQKGSSQTTNAQTKKRNQQQPSNGNQGSSKDSQQQPNKDNQGSGKTNQQPSKDNQGDNPQGSGMQGVLQQHNSYRARHGVPALSWSASVASSAQAYAEKCIFEHSGAKGLGENLATGYKDWTAAVKVWYDEESQYDYNAGQFSHATGHFTQLVWKTTKHLGCGYAPCSGRPMYVCQYSPAGNIIGSFQANVPRPVAS